MTAPATESTMVDIKVATPLPSSVLLTLGALLDSAYPGAQLTTNDEPYRNQVIFRVDNARRPMVDDEAAPELRVEPDDDDLDIIALAPRASRRLRRRSSDRAFSRSSRPPSSRTLMPRTTLSSRSTTLKATIGTC